MGNSRRLRRGVATGAAVATVTAAMAAFGAAPAQAAEGQIRDAGTPDAVAGSYLVVLKNSGVSKALNEIKATLNNSAKSLTGQYGAQLGQTFGAALNGFSVHATEAQAKRMAANGNVAYVMQNHRVHTTDTQQDPPSWGLDRVDQKDQPLDKAYNYTTKADNVTAYVIDTGVRASHETFGGRVSGGHDFIDNDNDPNDENGHGTHVAGTIGGNEYGLAKGVKIVPVRVLDAQGSGTTEQVVAGINWVTENHKGPSVANMSLGGTADDALDQAVKGAIAKGVTFAVAAGNESADASGDSPARVPEAITVAASDKTDLQAYFSNFGKVVDLYAPGVDITSSWGTGDTATKTISGTSMATPHVVGAAALYLAGHPDATPQQVSDALTGAATPDKITNASPGTPNKLLYTGQ
jgi:subtilisin family serine protease